MTAKPVALQDQRRIGREVFARGGSVLPAALAAVLGLFILYGAGIAQPEIIHDAAHDSRHAFAFPCH